jgi:hypothetical protein
MESNPSRNENEPNGDIPIKLMDCYVCTAADSSLTTFSASCAQSLPQPAFPTLRQGQEVHLFPVRTVLIIYLHTLLHTIHRKQQPQLASANEGVPSIKRLIFWILLTTPTGHRPNELGPARVQCEGCRRHHRKIAVLLPSEIHDLR